MGKMKKYAIALWGFTALFIAISFYAPPAIISAILFGYIGFWLYRHPPLEKKEDGSEEQKKEKDPEDQASSPKA